LSSPRRELSSSRVKEMVVDVDEGEWPGVFLGEAVAEVVSVSP
jgi:hypothetical protein